MQTEIFVECKNDILVALKNHILVFRIMAPCSLVGMCQYFSITMCWHSSFKVNCSNSTGAQENT